MRSARYRTASAFAVITAMAVVLTAGLSVGAQNDDQIQILSTLEEGNTVTLEVAIPPSIGSIAPVAENFGVTVGGSQPTFTVNPLTQVVDVAIVIDTSGSMQGQSIASAKSAAQLFVDQLPADTKISVIGFGASPTVLAPLTTDRDQISSAIDSLAASGETALWDGLVAAAEVLNGSTSDRTYVVLLSDGEESGVSSADQSQAISQLQSANTGLYAVAIESGEFNSANLEATVDAVGGQYLSASNLDALGPLYEDIAQRLTSRYLLVVAAGEGAERPLILSVAAGGSIATARTTVGTSSNSNAGTTPPVAPVINVDAEAALGRSVGPTPGPLSGSSAIVFGTLAIFGSLALIGGAFFIPHTEVSLGTSPTGRERASGLNRQLGGFADRLVNEHDGDGQLDSALDAAGINLRPGEFLVATAAATIVTGLIANLLWGLTAAILTIAMAGVSTYLYVSIKTNRRRARFADQLTDTLSIMAGSMRAGRGLPQAIELVSQEAASPTKEQFRRVVYETRVGRDLTDAMKAASIRMKNQDLEWVTRAIDINRELGGDLTEVLDNLASTIRDRRKIARQVRALSAEGRMSGWVMISLPFIMFLFLAWRTPDSAAMLIEHPLGRIMLGGALLGIVVGYLWIRKLVDLKY